MPYLVAIDIHIALYYIDLLYHLFYVDTLKNTAGLVSGAVHFIDEIQNSELQYAILMQAHYKIVWLWIIVVTYVYNL